MTREQLDKLILKTYGICADYPFEQDFTTGVFRHSDTGKWFAISMCIRARKLALDSEAMLDVVNLKCAPEVIESLVGSETGIFPAYHMKKSTLADCCARSMRRAYPRMAALHKLRSDKIQSQA